MNSNLYSYREGKSTEDALHKVVHKIEKAISTQKVAVALFLDIEAAFSNATIESMREGLQAKGVNKILIDWIVSSLKNRTAIAVKDSFSVKKKIEKGCPQGGILSPFLWNLIMDDLLKMFPKVHPTEIICYADDVLLLGSGIDEKSIISNLQKDVESLEAWAGKHKLNFSPSKTKLMLFSKRRNKIKPTLKLNQTPIDWVDSFKYLGITLDSKLGWTQHIENAINKATLALIQCRKLLGRQWGLNPKVMLWLYTAIVRPIMSYGSLVWAPLAENDRTKNKLNKLQRRACLMITNASCSTPTAGMEVILSLVPLNIHVKKCAITSHLRMRRQGTWTTKIGETGKSLHGLAVMRWAREIPNLDMPLDK